MSNWNPNQETGNDFQEENIHMDSSEMQEPTGGEQTGGGGGFKVGAYDFDSLKNVDLSQLKNIDFKDYRNPKVMLIFVILAVLLIGCVCFSLFCCIFFLIIIQSSYATTS